MKTKLFAVNPFREVTYVLSDDSGDCVIIDCGCSTETEFERLFDYIKHKSLTPKMIIGTHGHIDHILGVNRVKDFYSIPYALHNQEQLILDNAVMSAMMFGLPFDENSVPVIDIDLSKKESINFGNTTLKIIQTPGHTPGHISLYNEEDKVLFTGDTLFCGSIGRTDLPGGDYTQLMSSIINKIMPLGGDVTVYPGHGDHTTLAHEATYNPFITDVLQGDVNPGIL